MKTADLNPSAHCKLCGGHITGRNRYGICGKGPKCRAEYSRLYNLERGKPEHVRRMAEQSGCSIKTETSLLADIFGLVPGLKRDQALMIVNDIPKAERHRLLVHFWEVMVRAERAAARCCTAPVTGGAPGWLCKPVQVVSEARSDS
jgi:hypothetical protein